MAEEAAGLRVPLLLTLKGHQETTAAGAAVPIGPGELQEDRLQRGRRRLLPTSDQCGGSEWVQGGAHLPCEFA